MNNTIYSKFNKKDIKGLPTVSFPGRIITIMTEGEAERAVNYLLASDIVGVDTETKPSFRRGEQHQVALLQASNRDTCFLFRLNFIGITPAVKRFLEDRTVKKVGLSWHDDLRGLKNRVEFTPGWFIELQDMVPQIGIEDMSLQKLYANLFHQKISKRQRLSNWESPILDDKQKQYASIDAWACIKIYDRIEELKQTGNYTLIVTHDDESLSQQAPEKQSAPVSNPDNNIVNCGRRKGGDHQEKH